MFARRGLHSIPQLCLTRHQILTPTAVRAFSTTDLPNGIKLAYDLHEPSNAKEGSARNAPIVFIHGLFGSKKNNRSMSKYAPFMPTQTPPDQL